jgi:hypothetical protein
MAKRITVYPNPQAVQILGNTTPELNRALEVHSQQIVRATVSVSQLLSRGEWSYLADCFNGTIHEPRFSDIGDCLAQSVEDQDEFYQTGTKWGVDAAALAAKLRQLSYIEAWAVVTAVSWFWERHDCIDFDHDDWWTIEMRLKAVPAEREDA